MTEGFLLVWFYATSMAIFALSLYGLMQRWAKKKEWMHEEEAIIYIRKEIEIDTGKSYSKAFSPFFERYLAWAKENRKTISPLSTARQALNPNIKRVSKPDLIIDMAEYRGKTIGIKSA